MGSRLANVLHSGERTDPNQPFPAEEGLPEKTRQVSRVHQPFTLLYIWYTSMEAE